MDAGEAFLLAFHAGDPGLTSRAFAHGRGEDGRSSYERLADCVLADARLVLDLGCGDGYLLELLRRRGFAAGALTGIDMSPHELDRAHARTALRGVLLARARAQALPVANGAADAVVSHMAFMLMSDVERVVQEIARALIPGGLFATVVGGGPRAGDAFERFLDVVIPVYRRQPAQLPPLGDRRSRTDAGLAEIFSRETGFEDLAVEDFYLSLDDSLDAVWASLSTIYNMAVIPADERPALRSAFGAATRDLGRADGTIPCTMAMRLVAARRAG